MNRLRDTRRRWLLLPLAVLVALVSGAAVLAMIGNHYRIREERVFIPGADGILDAVLVRPANTPGRGLVVMVHGDGPVDATQEGLYRPWFEAAADAGFVTLSWSKPGVGASSGDWLRQSMDDRATEVSTAIDWARRQPDVPTDTVVLWGASQAGWVLPKIVASRDGIDAVVAVGPAVNWLRQGRYNLLAQLEHERADVAERERAVYVSDQTRKLLDEGADYDTFRAATADPDPMSAERWYFVKRNYTSDATADLRAMRDRKAQVLLMLGEHDRNVDITETAGGYQEAMGERVTVQRFDAAHSMAKPSMEDSGLLGLVTAVFWPRALLADGVLDAYRDYLEAR